jgi:uncharacterized protein YjbI with pentapeptide repeats
VRLLRTVEVLGSLLCEACFVHILFWMASWFNLARITLPARTLGEHTFKALLCKSSLARSKCWRAHYMRGLLCEACFMRVNLGDANSAFTLCVLQPLQSFMLNLAKLCKANFAHKKCRRAYFAGLSLRGYFAWV